MTAIERRGVIFIVMAAWLGGCDASRSRSSGDMNQIDLDFVTNAFNIIDFDREECGLAVTQAISPAVRDLAAQLLRQANAFDARLRPIAASAGVTPPDVLRTVLRVRVARLRLNQGLDFDRTFVGDQIYSHEDALGLQEMMLGTASSNAQLQALSRDGTVLLRTNLETLRQIQRQMMVG